MGNEPGPLRQGESSIVLLRLNGPIDAPTAQHIRDAVEKLMKEYGPPKTGGIERPIKKKEA